MTTAINNIDHFLQYVKFNLEELDNTYNVEYTINTERIGTYTISVKCMKYKNKQAVIEIIISNQTIGDNTITNHATDLALQCGKILYPVELIINDQAQIIGINNHKAIINRWLNESPQIISYYIGEAAENYIRQTEKHL